MDLKMMVLTKYFHLSRVACDLLVERCLCMKFHKAGIAQSTDSVTTSANLSKSRLARQDSLQRVAWMSFQIIHIMTDACEVHWPGHGLTVTELL